MSGDTIDEFFDKFIAISNYRWEQSVGRWTATRTKKYHSAECDRDIGQLFELLPDIWGVVLECKGGKHYDDHIDMEGNPIDVFDTTAFTVAGLTEVYLWVIHNTNYKLGVNMVEAACLDVIQQYIDGCSYQIRQEAYDLFSDESFGNMTYEKMNRTRDLFRMAAKV